MISRSARAFVAAVNRVESVNVLVSRRAHLSELSLEVVHPQPGSVFF